MVGRCRPYPITGYSRRVGSGSGLSGARKIFHRVRAAYSSYPVSAISAATPTNGMDSAGMGAMLLAATRLVLGARPL
jgi:hypothetical protein